jgi:hypothetical protein
VRVRPNDFAQLAVLAARLLVAEVALRFRRVDRVAAMFGMSFTDPDRDLDRGAGATFTASQREARWLLNAARLLRRWPWDRSCLRRSLIVGWILRGSAPELMIGTRFADGVVRAHAWVRIGSVDLDASAHDHATFE